ncbi:hypothetical protein D3C84_678180 [compost metagenome]
MFGQPVRAFRVDAIGCEIGVLLQQAGLQCIQFGPDLIKVRSRYIGRLVGGLPDGEQSVLHQFVGLNLGGDQLGSFVRVEFLLHRLLAGVGDDLCFAGRILDRLATVPFGQRHLIGNIQPLVDRCQQRLQRIGGRGGGGVSSVGE